MSKIKVYKPVASQQAPKT